MDGAVLKVLTQITGEKAHMTFLPEHATDLWQTVVGGILTYFADLIAVRLVGLRGFAKIAPHDFAVTVAVGSVLASAAMASSTPLGVPLVEIAVLFLLRLVVLAISPIYFLHADDHRRAHPAGEGRDNPA